MVGIRDGAVLQRGDDNTCELFLHGEPIRECIFGSDSLCESATVTEAGPNRFKITGIPVGGPYFVSVNGEVFCDIYVGDVWLLAGQSNMEGNGIYRPDDQTPKHEDIHAYTLEGRWERAAHPLHRPIFARDNSHRLDTDQAKKEWAYKGVGPGIAFSKRMKELCSVPQGLICCAKGGTSLEDWNPDKRDLGGDSLFGSLCISLRDCGGNARGIFWAQGCSEGMSGNREIGEYFSRETARLFLAMREEIGKEVPIVEMQISRLYGFDPDTTGESFSSVREQQRRLKESVRGLSVVPTINLRLDDIVHFSADAQDSLGRQAAEAMYCAVFGTAGGVLPPIEYSGCSVYAYPHTGNAIITVRYKNVSGELSAAGRVMGFALSSERLRVDGNRIFDAYTEKDSVVLRTGSTVEEAKGLFLSYGWGLIPDCNVVDSLGRSIPAMCGIEIK